MKKTSTLLFSSVPLLLALGIQVAALFYLLLIAAIFLFIVAPLTTGVQYEYSVLEDFMQNVDFMQIFYVTFAISCITTFGIWYVKRCNGNLLPNIKKDFHPLEFVGILFLIPGTQFMSSVVTGMINVVFPKWIEQYQELMETAGIADDITLGMIIYTVILAPIGEELIFRGVTLQVAKRAFPFWIANIIQAFFFGVFHQNMVQGCYTFILGLFLGYICEKGGSIYHVILFHFLFNVWGVLGSEWLLVENEMLQASIILIGTVAGILLGLFFFNKGSNKKTSVAQ